MTEAVVELPPEQPREAPRSLLRQILAQGVTAGLIKLAAIVFSYLFLILLARNISEAEYGRYGFAISLVVFLGALATGGQQTAIVRFWPQFLGQGDPARAKGALWLGFGTVLAFSFVIMLLAVLVVSLGKLVNPGLATGYLYAAAFMVLPAGLCAFQSAALRAQGSVVGALLPSDILHRGGLLLALLFLLLQGGSEITAESMLWISGLLWLLVLAPQTVRILVGARRAAPDVAADYGIAGWRSSGAVFLALTLFGVLSQSADVLVLGLYFGPEETGGYFAALKVASLFLLFFLAANILSGPMISRAFHRGDLAEVQRICRAVSGLMVVPALLGLAIVVFAGPQILGFFGPAYSEAYPLLTVLATGTVCFILNGPAGSVLMMTGNERTLLKMLCISRVGMVVLQVALVPLIGPLGAALGNAFGNIALSLWARQFLRRCLGVDPSFVSLLSGRSKAAEARP